MELEGELHEPLAAFGGGRRVRPAVRLLAEVLGLLAQLVELEGRRQRRESTQNDIDGVTDNRKLG
jgi:hypothetical protein